MLEETPKNGLDTNALKAWKIWGIIKSFFILLLPVAFFILSHFFGPFPHIFGWLLLGGALLSAYLVIFIVPKLRFIRWRYEIREHDIDLQRGILILTRTLIPFIRVQHISTVQGPILKRYGLTTLMIFTAGSGHEIPALKTEVAVQLKHQISEMARLSKEDV